MNKQDHLMRSATTAPRRSHPKVPMNNWQKTSLAALIACVVSLFLAPATASATPLPIIAITSQNGLVTSNATLVVTGTALSLDTNDHLASITVTVNGNAQIATGTRAWSAPVTLSQGVNTITAQATTQNNVQSDIASIKVRLLVFSTLTVTTNGSGTVSPDLNGQSTLVGQHVTLRATPALDWIFNGWSGTDSSTNRVINFTMQQNESLTANFVPHPLSHVRGKYNGLIMNSNNIVRESSGAFTLMVTFPDAYVMRMVVGGVPAVATGRFDNNGHADFTAQTGDTTFSGSLQLDLTGGSDQVTGDLTSPVSANILGDRPVFSKANPCPFGGSYTMLIGGNSSVQGFGFASVFVDGMGRLTMSGTLADGTHISQNTTVSKNGSWPMYRTLYGDRGALIGRLDITNIPQSSLHGPAYWFHPATPNGVITNQFSERDDVTGSLFIRPPAGMPIMVWHDGTATVGGDDLSGNLTSHLTWSATNGVNVDLSDFTFTVGQFGGVRGTLLQPVTHHPDVMRGIILPKTNWAGGFFLDSNSSGFFMINQDLSAGTNATVDAPGDINTGVLTLTLDTATGFFTDLNTMTFNIGATTLTSSDVSGFGTAEYNYSSYSSTGANIAELNMIGGKLRQHTTVIRMLLHFVDNGSGTFTATFGAGGSGVATGTFTLP
jgi:uncharacterized repeat protein (TIGR02543 family)